ncbi:hypothetical protein KKB69_00580 [Patescibacteria group bacterium]|nr:hypothetical protein [Patescibacteria group bacterium]
MRKFLITILFCLLIFPAIVFAEATVKGIIGEGVNIVKAVIEFFWLLAFAVFIWGIIKFIAAAGNPEKRKTAKDLLIYGLLGVFVMLSFIGIIKILQNTIFEGDTSTSEMNWEPNYPSLSEEIDYNIQYAH